MNVVNDLTVAAKDFKLPNELHHRFKHNKQLQLPLSLAKFHLSEMQPQRKWRPMVSRVILPVVHDWLKVGRAAQCRWRRV